MKKTILIFKILLSIVIFFAYILSGCKKDENSAPNTQVEIKDTNEIKLPFIIGVDNSTVTITPYDSTKRSYYIEIDVDNDGALDFDFLFHDLGSPGSSGAYRSEIKSSNHNIELAYSHQKDSVFECITEHEYNGEISTFYNYYNKTSGYKCPHSNETFYELYENDFLNMYQNGDTLLSTEKWRTDYVYFNYVSETAYEWGNGAKFWAFYPSKWHGAGVQYAVFRIKKNGNYKYGWLKLKTDKYARVFCHEYAIQN